MLANKVVVQDLADGIILSIKSHLAHEDLRCRLGLRNKLAAYLVADLQRKTYQPSHV